MAIHDYIVLQFRYVGNVVANEIKDFSLVTVCGILFNCWGNIGIHCAAKSVLENYFKGYLRLLHKSFIIYLKYHVFFVETLQTRIFLLFAVGAQVSLTIKDVIEVYKGDSVVIPCQYNFEQVPKTVTVQWFLVCTLSLVPRIRIGTPSINFYF